MKYFINSEPQQKGDVASCFVGMDFKAFTEPEKQAANERGYVKQSAKLRAHGEMSRVLMGFSKGDQVDIVADWDGVHVWSNGQQCTELVLKGVAGQGAGAAKSGRRMSAPSQDDIFSSEDEIPF